MPFTLEYISCCIAFFLSIAMTTSNAATEFLNAVMIVTFVIVFGREIFQNRRSPRLSVGPDLWIWAFWFFGLIGSIYLTPLTFLDRFRVFGEYRWILTLYALVWLFSFLGSKKERREQVIEVLFFSSSIVAAFAISQVIFGFDPSRDPRSLHEIGNSGFYRARGLFNITTTYSYAFGMLSCLYLAYLTASPRRLQWSKPKRFTFWLGYSILILSLFLTFTRGLWVSLTLASLAILWFSNRASFKRVSLALVITGALSVLIFPTFRARLATIGDLSNQISERRDLWQVNLEMFKESPIFGQGMGRNQILVREYNLKVLGREALVSHAHNNFIQVLAGGGLLGALCYLGFSIGFVLITVRHLRNQQASPHLKAYALAALGAQIVLHIGGLTECVFSDNESTMVYLWILALMTSESLLVSRQ